MDKTKKYQFTAEIKSHDNMDAAYIEFPFIVEEAFGTKGQVKVKAYFNRYEYRGSLVNMGLDYHCIGITKNIRKAINRQAGDTIQVELQQDLEPRIVLIPDDLNDVLHENPSAKKFFESLSYSNQNQYVQWIINAKKLETRKNRLQRTVENLINGKKRP
ncbi:antitermination protein NusB [Oceanobacillus zhaokaii]|uniref:Antitermination protein NusB n=1 Tax=Oceanobacillus zhaokaii TaxID=2052660 RepID=A0A345PF58_9BACI|nr:YdeI/OmpD-associated family protein [Oceanobacillus zhaokaii]AXI08638.1 antitermination protein NusB [Oceanobacillus zhaokaii]